MNLEFGVNFLKLISKVDNKRLKNGSKEKNYMETELRDRSHDLLQ